MWQFVIDISILVLLNAVLLSAAAIVVIKFGLLPGVKLGKSSQASSNAIEISIVGNKRLIQDLTASYLDTATSLRIITDSNKRIQSDMRSTPQLSSGELAQSYYQRHQAA